MEKKLEKVKRASIKETYRVLLCHVRKIRMKKVIFNQFKAQFKYKKYNHKITC